MIGDCVPQKIRICPFPLLMMLFAAPMPDRIEARVAPVFLQDMSARAVFIGMVHEERVSQIPAVSQFLSEPSIEEQ